MAFYHYCSTVSPSGPAGSIYSSASDMAKWMMFHLKGGKDHHGKQVVNERWLQDTYQSKMTHPFQEKDLTRPKYPISDVTISYNMGWMTSFYRGMFQDVFQVATVCINTMRTVYFTFKEQLLLFLGLNC
jgi:CubicO group peptidase (beta-lactamase class C family)